MTANTQTTSRIWPLLAALLIGFVGIDWALLPKPASADAYHARIRLLAAGLPMDIGNWIGSNVPVPEAAVKMLSPNVIVSRRYVNAVTGDEASLLLVQCGDARDIVVHYPPVCLCNAGWTLVSSELHDWQQGTEALHGTEYRFEMHALDQSPVIVVDNFMLMPDRPVAPNMDAVNEAAGDVRRRYFGAAQVQVITSAAMSAENRRAAFHDLVSALQPTLSAIREGIKQ